MKKKMNRNMEDVQDMKGKKEAEAGPDAEEGDDMDSVDQMKNNSGSKTSHKDMRGAGNKNKE